MKYRSRVPGATLAALPVAIAFALCSSSIFANGPTVPLIEVESMIQSWDDPDSGGHMSVNAWAFEGCGSDPFQMTWRYRFYNVSYNPWPYACWDEANGCSNGLSGFQLVFDQPINELHMQTSPNVGGPWDQNQFSGTAPPWGVEWDVDFDDWDESGAPENLGIMPGEIGFFSFCTDERVAKYDSAEGSGQGPSGWVHSWGMYPYDGPATQINIFHAPIMIPGDLYTDLGLTCSAADRICKKVKFLDEDGDEIVEVGEQVLFRTVIHANIPGSGWTDAELKDNFGGQLLVGVVGDNGWAAASGPELTFRGKSEKASLFWNIGDLGDGAEGNMFTVVLDAATDITPGGDQSYTRCGLYEINSGAVLKFRDDDQKKHSFNTGSVYVPVFTENMTGDCDDDGYSDGFEVTHGSDPFDPDSPGSPP